MNCRETVSPITPNHRNGILAAAALNLNQAAGAGSLPLAHTDTASLPPFHGLPRHHAWPLIWRMPGLAWRCRRR